MGSCTDVNGEILWRGQLVALASASEDVAGRAGSGGFVAADRAVADALGARAHSQAAPLGPASSSSAGTRSPAPSRMHQCLKKATTSQEPAAGRSGTYLTKETGNARWDGLHGSARQGARSREQEESEAFASPPGTYRASRPDMPTGIREGRRP